MLNNHYPYLDTILINFINHHIDKRQNFSEDLFQNWINENHIQERNNPSSYIQRCFLKELSKGTFDKEPELVQETPVTKACTVPMFCYMREIGIKVTQESTSDIDVVMNYILRNKILTVNELIELNTNIIKHLKENSVRSDGFIPLMKQSKTLAGKINWKDVDAQIEDARKKWAEILADFK